MQLFRMNVEIVLLFTLWSRVRLQHDLHCPIRSSVIAVHMGMLRLTSQLLSEFHQCKQCFKAEEGLYLSPKSGNGIRNIWTKSQK